jgi:hypothetical protein
LPQGRGRGRAGSGHRPDARWPSRVPHRRLAAGIVTTALGAARSVVADRGDDRVVRVIEWKELGPHWPAPAVPAPNASQQ